MPSLTIRNLEPDTKDELRRVATAHGRSMQDEARHILARAILEKAPPKPTHSENESLYAYVRSLVEPLGGIDDLEIPLRDIGRDPPTFD